MGTEHHSVGGCRPAHHSARLRPVARASRTSTVAWSATRGSTRGCLESRRICGAAGRRRRRRGSSPAMGRVRRTAGQRGRFAGANDRVDPGSLLRACQDIARQRMGSDWALPAEADVPHRRPRAPVARESETFVDESFAPAKQGGAGVAKTKRGKARHTCDRLRKLGGSTTVRSRSDGCVSGKSRLVSVCGPTPDGLRTARALAALTRRSCRRCW